MPPTFINLWMYLRKLGQISSLFCICTSVGRHDKEASDVSGMINTFGSLVQGNMKWRHRKWRHFALLSRLKYAVSQIKRGKKMKKSTTHFLQQCNLSNNQQLYQPRTASLMQKVVVSYAQASVFMFYILTCFRNFFSAKGNSSCLVVGTNFHLKIYAAALKPPISTRKMYLSPILLL